MRISCFFSNNYAKKYALNVNTAKTSSAVSVDSFKKYYIHYTDTLLTTAENLTYKTL